MQQANPVCVCCSDGSTPKRPRLNASWAAPNSVALKLRPTVLHNLPPSNSEHVYSVIICQTVNVYYQWVCSRCRASLGHAAALLPSSAPCCTSPAGCWGPQQAAPQATPSSALSSSTTSSSVG